MMMVDVTLTFDGFLGRAKVTADESTGSFKVQYCSLNSNSLNVHNFYSEEDQFYASRSLAVTYSSREDGKMINGNSYCDTQEQRNSAPYYCSSPQTIISNYLNVPFKCTKR